MRNPTDVLANLTEEAKNENYKFQRLYRNLYNPEFYWLAYKNIYANTGSMTAGSDGTTIDGMSNERITKIIQSLRDRSYQPKPARREYIAKKNSKKKRPLGIQSGDDKLVQEVVKMILESIYEPTFCKSSHGFRPNRSCQTALMQVQNTFTGTKWFIEGDMAAFSVVCDAVNQAKITATLPGNKTEGDVEICTVAGAMIRRKTGSYPVNETDGEEVTDLKQSGTYTDMGLTGDTIYYYAAFPYSDRGMFNRNQTAENQASCKVFAPVAPGNMKAFSASSAAAGKIVLTATLPDNTVESGVTTSAVAGVMIRRKLDGYSANETDGTLVAKLTESGTYTDTDIVGGQMYYYGAFPYSDKGLYNQNAVPENQASAEGKTYEYLYGYDLDTANSNPATRVTYPADVDNTGFAAAKMGTSAFNYGGWPSTPGEKFMPRPCMLTFAGKVDHYLNPNDYTKKDSSTESRAASNSSDDGSYSKVADTSFGGNAMMEWPKIFVKRWQEGNIYHFRVSDVKLDDDFECWSNYDRQNHEIEHFYTPIFFGSNVSSKLRSISGQANSVSTTADQEITYAKANGADWYTEVVADRMLINDLLTMMAKSTDLQTAYGSGRTKSSNSSAIAPGTMNTKGMFWGFHEWYGRRQGLWHGKLVGEHLAAYRRVDAGK